MLWVWGQLNSSEFYGNVYPGEGQMIAFDSTRKEEQGALRRSMELFTEKSSESGKAQAADGKASEAEALGRPDIPQGVICSPTNFFFCK